MKLRRYLTFVAVAVLCLISVSCGHNPTSSTTDYAQTTHWLSLPVPLKKVDIFYLYPTSWNKISETDPNICEIDNPSMLAGSKAAFARQVTAFDPVGNIYAPYYRQADADYTLTLPTLAEREQVIAGAPTRDAVAAFDYYIRHFNNGRPFILAGHSQGSNVLLNLLSGYLKDHPDVYDRMIAAYVIGYSVTSDYLKAYPHLKFATRAGDTGVIISYNTQSPGTAANRFVLPGARVINPINWKTDDTPAPASEGLGSYMPVDGTGTLGKVPQYADARIDLTKGALITTADPSGLQQINGIFHGYDYPFYYFNLRENAAVRAANYLTAHAAER